MATNCEDVSARMMELLYGELAADERATVDAHVAGCARCRSELEGFEKTRAVARRAMDEAPPARAHAAILKAAAAHVAAQAQPAARKAVAPERPSLWARLRGRWAFPTFATVGAVAVFVIANRVFLNPERTLEKVHHEAAEAPAPGREAPALAPTTGGVATAPPASEAAKASDSEGELRQRLQDARARLDEAQRGARFERHGKKELEAPAEMQGGEQKPAATGRSEDYRRLGKDAPGAASPTPSHASRRSISDNALDGLMDDDVPAAKEKSDRDRPRSSTRFAPPPPPRAAPAAAQEGRSADKAPSPKRVAAEAGDGFEPAPTSPRSPPATAAKPAGPAKGSLDDLLDGSSGGGRVGGLAGGKNKGGGYGSGPSAQPAPVTTSSGAPTAKQAAPSPAIAPAPAAPPPPPVSKARAKAYDDAEEAAAAPEADTKAEKKRKAGGDKAYASETLAQRAERLFAAGRWAEAAEVYRELLQRDPRNEEAERWRRRLVAAESADAGEHNASIAERRAIEAKAAKKAAPAKPAKAAPKAAASDALEQ